MSSETTTESDVADEEGREIDSEAGIADGERRETGPGGADREGSGESEDGGITEGMEMVGPLEPQEIDTENAAFLLVGVVLTAGLLLAALAGL